MEAGDTIVAPATPAGRSAVAIVRASGPAVRTLIHNGLGVDSPTPRLLSLGRWVDAGNRALDDLLWVFFEGPNSYTGEDILELHLHGNPFIVRRVMDDLVARGCRPAEAGEFTKRAFLNGRLSLEQAEAVADLLEARSGAAVATALGQLGGELGRRVGMIAAVVHDLLAEVEVRIDFPEDDVPPEEPDIEGAIEAALGGIRALRGSAGVRERQQEGWRIVLAGAPNAGKSSLLNALAGVDRAIVDAEPGTTRDTLDVLVPLGGSLLRLVDTAGIRDDAGRVERLGIQRTINEIGDADLVLLLAASDSPPPASLPAPDRTWLIRSKADLLPHPAWAEQDPGGSALAVSTRGTPGVGRLRMALEAWVARREPPADVVLVSARHEQALALAEAHLAACREHRRAGNPEALVAHELRQAWRELGHITGRSDPETLLDTVFSRFCIGK